MGIDVDKIQKLVRKIGKSAVRLDSTVQAMYRGDITRTIARGLSLVDDGIEAYKTIKEELKSAEKTT